MSTWLHHIGASFYPTPKAFVEEALKYGVTRRVSLQTLKRMNWADLVLLATPDGKSRVIFGEYNITKLSGISGPGWEAIRQGAMDLGKTATMQSVPVRQGQVITRGCGSYVVAAKWELHSGDLSLGEIAEILQKAKDAGTDIGKPMVGCDVGEFYERKLYVRMKDLPHAHGFRLFDHEKWTADVIHQLVDGTKRWLRGHYYVDKEKAAELEAKPLVWGANVRIEQVATYTRGEGALAT